MTHHQRPNKIWEWIWKFNQVLMAIVLPWAIWVTVQTFENKAFREKGGRFSSENGLELKVELLERIAALKDKIDAKDQIQDSAISESPSQEWKARIVLLETMAKENRERLIRIETAVTKQP